MIPIFQMGIVALIHRALGFQGRWVEAAERKRIMPLKMNPWFPAVLLAALISPWGLRSAMADITLSTGTDGMSHFSQSGSIGAIGLSSGPSLSMSQSPTPLPKWDSVQRVAETAPATHRTAKKLSGPLPAQASTARTRSIAAVKAEAYNRRRYHTVAARAAKKHGLDRQLVQAVIAVESGHNPRAVSPKGAIGLMQLLPGTARQYGVINLFDPVQNVNGGTRYLKHLLDIFNGDLRLALAAYNAGEGNVMRFGRAIPPFRETRQYVMKVLAIYRQASVR